MVKPPVPGAFSPGHPIVLNDGAKGWLRPLRADDDRFFAEFDRHVTADDRRLRFFSSLRELSERQIEALTHYDRTHADAVIALTEDGQAMTGVARLHGTEGREGEFALLVRSDLKGLGLGGQLLDYLFGRARRIGVSSVHGYVLRENRPMLAFARDFGFEISAQLDDPDIVRAGLRLPVCDRTVRVGA